MFFLFFQLLMPRPIFARPKRPAGGGNPGKPAKTQKLRPVLVSRLEWNGLEWNHGVEWSGMDFSGVRLF